MAEKKEKPTDVAQSNVGHRFEESHPRFGGRKKRTAQQARDLAQQLGVDPLEYMLNLLTKDVVEEVEIDAKGKERRIKVPIGHELKIDICKTLANFFYPRLSATQVTGRDEGPLAVATLDVSAILANPELAKAAQDLALAICDAETAQERADRGLPEPGIDRFYEG